VQVAFFFYLYYNQNWYYEYNHIATNY
jgi:hypothetical protein